MPIYCISLSLSNQSIDAYIFSLAPSHSFSLSLSLSLSVSVCLSRYTHTHTHTHIHIYIYMYIYACLCLCVVRAPVCVCVSRTILDFQACLVLLLYKKVTYIFADHIVIYLSLSFSIQIYFLFTILEDSEFLQYPLDLLTMFKEKSDDMISQWSQPHKYICIRIIRKGLFLFGLVFWHINHYKLFNAKFIFIQINSFILNNSV